MSERREADRIVQIENYSSWPYGQERKEEGREGGRNSGVVRESKTASA